jgi:hypothetical protein
VQGGKSNPPGPKPSEFCVHKKVLIGPDKPSVLIGCDWICTVRSTEPLQVCYSRLPIQVKRPLGGHADRQF